MNTIVRIGMLAAIAAPVLAPAAFAQGSSCTQYGIVQAVGRSPQQTTLHVIVLGQMGAHRRIVLPAASGTAYKPGQRICIAPPPTK
jgi:hypothetical protein